MLIKEGEKAMGMSDKMRETLLEIVGTSDFLDKKFDLEENKGLDVLTVYHLHRIDDSLSGIDESLRMIYELFNEKLSEGK